MYLKTINLGKSLIQKITLGALGSVIRRASLK